MNALATVCYADIFEYPLTRKEFHLWSLFSSRPKLTAGIDGTDGYIVLRGRKRLVKIWKKKAPWQEKKWIIARRAAAALSRIPTINLIGVTGGLAMNNAGRKDDIDLFFVVAGGTLWVTRLMATLLMDVFGLRRRPGDRNITDKVCLNMFMTEGALALPQKERDVFTAHEVLQMQPIFDREKTYRRFLQANTWVRKYLPNAWQYRNNI